MAANQAAPIDAQCTITDATALASQLDLTGWYRELSTIRLASETLGLALHVDDPRIRIIQRPDGVDILQVSGPHANFAANLGMSNVALKEHFERWLEIAREQVPTPRTTRGPDALNNGVDDQLFARWRANRIIEYAHLLIWRAQDHARAKYNVDTLGTWIRRGTEAERRHTRNALCDALLCLPMLLGQCELESLRANDQATRTDVAKRIRNDLSRDLSNQ